MEVTFTIDPLALVSSSIRPRASMMEAKKLTWKTWSQSSYAVSSAARREPPWPFGEIPALLHRPLLVAVELLQIEGIRLIDAVAEPLAFDRAVERVAARDRLMDAEAQRDRFVLRGRSAAGTSSRSRTSPPRFTHAGCWSSNENSGSAAVHARRRCDCRTEARREQPRRDQEARALGPVHSVRPSTHKPTANGWKPTRSYSAYDAVVVGLRVDVHACRAAPAQPIESVGDERGSEPLSLRFGPHCEALHVPVDRCSPEERVADQSAVVVATHRRAVHPQVRARGRGARPRGARRRRGARSRRTRPGRRRASRRARCGGRAESARHLGQVREVVHEDAEPAPHRESGVDQREGGRGHERVGDHFPVAGRADPIEQAFDSGGLERPPPAHGERCHVGPSVPVRDPHDAAAISERLRLHENRKRSDTRARATGLATLVRCSWWRPIRAWPSTIPAAGTPSDRSGCKPSSPGWRRSGSTRRCRSFPPGGRRGPMERVHAAKYLDQLEAFCARGGGSLDADTAASAGSWDAALLAAGIGPGGRRGARSRHGHRRVLRGPPARPSRRTHPRRWASV